MPDWLLASQARCPSIASRLSGEGASMSSPASISPDKMASSDKIEAGHGIGFGEAFRVWLRIALLSFGGPAGQIAVMHRILVDEKRWVSEGRFLHALNYCMLLLGPEAQQVAS